MAEGNWTLKNEQTVREYFEKPGWKVTKLDTGKGEAADFRVCREDSCFLCEVKTIESDRESRPPGPSEDYFASRRKEPRDVIQAHLNTHPDVQVVLPPSQWEDLYGPEDNFLQRYSNVHRGTLKPFEDFGRSLKRYLEKSSVGNTPYMLRLDSDDLYVPGHKERDEFFRWLEGQLLDIAAGKVAADKKECRFWHVEQTGPSGLTTYSMFHTIHTPHDGENWRSLYQLTVRGPKSVGTLDVEVHGYGGLNYESIHTNVTKASRQLAASASRESDSEMPRTVVLALRSGLSPDDWLTLHEYVVQLFCEHADLSAIAVLVWKPDTTAPPADAPFQVWTEYLAVPAVPTFIVYHNTNPQDVRPVPIDVFWDKWSVHLPPQKSYREEGQVGLETPNRKG